jgi:hypothetical protein
MNYNPERPSTRKRFSTSGQKELTKIVSFEIIETQVGEVDVYLNVDMKKGEVLDFLYEELKGMYVGNIYKLTK